jgi:predicted DNA-binding transcriptional regulator AlpA
MALRRPSAEDREPLLAVVDRLRREYGEMTREFERVCRDQQGVTPIQLSAILGVKYSTLAKWRKDGNGPRFVKHGSRILYSSRELEAWLRARLGEQAAGGGAGNHG